MLVNKVKLRHSPGRPSRSDFVQLEFVDILLDGGADFHGDNRIRKMKIYNRSGVPKEIFTKMKQAGWDPGLF